MTPSDLSSDKFSEWRKRLGMSQSAAAKSLGVSMSSIYSYEIGRRKEGEVKIPLLVCLGMSAISSGLTPYDGESNADSI